MNYYIGGEIWTIHAVNKHSADLMSKGWGIHCYDSLNVKGKTIFVSKDLGKKYMRMFLNKELYLTFKKVCKSDASYEKEIKEILDAFMEAVDEFIEKE